MASSFNRRARKKLARAVRFERLEERLPFAADTWFAASPVDFRTQHYGPLQLEQSFIVQLRPDTAASVVAADVAFARKGLDVVRGLGAEGLVQANTALTMAQIQAMAGVVRVETNSQVFALASDPIPTWGIQKIGVNAQVRQVSTGLNTIVAVLDTGVAFDHPDLLGQVAINAREIAGNGRDDDGNGFVDDVNGWDFVSNDNNPRPDVPSELHGTHVAGTIAALTSNGIGVESVAPGTKILPLRFLNSSGSGAISGAIAAVNYATMLRKAGSPIYVMNASFGGGGYSKPFQEALNRASAAGIVMVAAAGNSNSNNDTVGAYPANYDGVISVAATDPNDARATFSNYGQSVDIAAPGVAINSTIPGGYGTLNGTSMAAPHVSGAMALLRSHEPNLIVAQATDRLMASADIIPGLAVKSGRLNVAKLLGLPSVGTPTGLQVVNRFESSSDIRFNAVSNATKYEIESYVNGRLIATQSTSSTSARIASVSTQVTQFRVRALAGTQSGAWSAFAEIVPRAVVSIENRYRNALDISFTQPGTAQAFRLAYSQDGGRTWTTTDLSASQRRARISGLNSNTDIRVRVDTILANEVIRGVEQVGRTKS